MQRSGLCYAFYSTLHSNHPLRTYLLQGLISALVCLSLLLLPASPVWAEQGLASASVTTDADANVNISTSTNISTKTPSSPSPTSTNNASTETAQPAGTAIERFVAGDFAARQAMLNSWPGSADELDTLVMLIDTDALYQDKSGHTYLLETGPEGDETLRSYPDKKVLTDWPRTLKQVTLTNALRSALIFGQAKVKLASDLPAQRLKAVQILDNHLDQVDPAIIATALTHERDDKVKQALISLKARMSFHQGDINDPALLKDKLTALAILKDSSSPEMLVDIESALTTLAQSPNPNPQLQAALIEAKDSIAFRIKMSEWGGHIFTGMSTASILLLAALGLAITFGLLGVINMAHGELIMIGAYTTYMVQNLFQSYLAQWLNWYLIAAIPAAFLVSAIIGMVIERIVIRPLYGRELETLLATFGVSLILMQLVRMIFGAQNVEVTNITWLSGAYQLTPSLSLPFNRIAIIAFTAAVLMLLLYLLNKTRFGLFIRAVTQNRQMARAVGIRSARIDMLAFGLGSGLAGLAGCALAQVGNVGPDLGQTYIIDAFLVVVVGGVGQVWGAVLASLGLGVSGTVLEIGMGAVLAKIILLVLVILFIQKRPQGLFALKGRFVE